MLYVMLIFYSLYSEAILALRHGALTADIDPPGHSAWARQLSRIALLFLFCRSMQYPMAL